MPVPAEHVEIHCLSIKTQVMPQEWPGTTASGGHVTLPTYPSRFTVTKAGVLIFCPVMNLMACATEIFQRQERRHVKNLKPRSYSHVVCNLSVTEASATPRARTLHKASGEKAIELRESVSPSKGPDASSLLCLL